MKKIKLILALCLYISITSTALAQLSPPGLGETKTAFWSAVGVKQKLDKKNTSLTYFGLGRISGTQASNPFENPSINIINQEFYHKLNNSWQYSYAASYRRQYKYHSFDNHEPVDIHQEFRLYGRLAYSANIGSFIWKTTLRQEARKFYDKNFANVPDDFQLRTRIKTQLKLPMDNNAVNSILGSAEVLFSITRDDDSGWEDYSYKETRFSLYYSYSPQSLPLTLDIGYMNDLAEHEHRVTDSHYLAVDIIMNNIF